jgi:Peptidase of plants and bacteria
MRKHSRLLIAVAVFGLSAPVLKAQPPASVDGPVAAVVESSLETAKEVTAKGENAKGENAKGKNAKRETVKAQIRQFAFDGDPETYFLSKGNPTTADHFTVIFDKPVAMKSIVVATGKPKGGDGIEGGILEVSADGKEFTELVKFQDTVLASPKGQKIQALRIKPAADLQHPLAIREFLVESTPPVASFKYPVEIVIDVRDAPEMKEWAEKTARVCERNYTMLNEELWSEGFKPRTVINMALKTSYKGVAQAGGGNITGSVAYFKKNPDDIGAMVHETAHCVQAYRGRNPSWLVEGVADYVRFFKYEPGKIGKLTKTPKYDASYRTTAAFLAFVTENYDKELVKKLNKAMREGEYNEAIWKVITKKTVQELNEEWVASVKK